MRPIIRLMCTLSGEKVHCHVHNEMFTGHYIRVRDNGDPEEPKVICSKCVDLLYNIQKHKCYVYDWKEPVRN